MRKRGTALREVQDESWTSDPSTGSGRAVVENPALPDHSTKLMTGFAPVPRRYRHDGWTPERQKAFIEALADTGCVSRAASMVNMAQTNCYSLRRAPGAEEFRRAWDAALDFGLTRLKDIAFERAIEGEWQANHAGGMFQDCPRQSGLSLGAGCVARADAAIMRVTVNIGNIRCDSDVPGSRHDALLIDVLACPPDKLRAPILPAPLRAGCERQKDDDQLFLDQG